MRGFLAVFRREFSAYFAGPLGSVVAIAYIVASSGWFVFYDLFRDNQASLRAFFEQQPAILSILGSLVGMRLWAEERRTGTIETLMTLPVGRVVPVAGKFAAGWAFIGFCLLFTFPLPVSLFVLGEPDTGVMLCGYAGVFVLGGFCVALGGLASALTRDQIVAAVVGTVAGLALWLLSVPVTVSSLDAAGEWLSKVQPFGFLPVGDWLSKFAPFGFLGGTHLGESLAVFSHGSHLSNIARGLFDAGDAAYFVLATGLLLWLTGLALESERLGVRTLPLAALVGGRLGLSGRLRAHAASLLAATLLLFGCAIFLQRAAAAGRWQADLTQEKVFTLSDATGKILRSLEGDPVKVTWYLSESLPASMRDLPRRTLDRLEGMSRLAPGRLRFEIVRPEKDERVRARLQEDRVTPVPIREETFDSVSYREIFTHMAVNYHDRPTYYMRFGQDEELEYSLLRAVLWLRLGRETPRIAALVPPPHGDTGVIVPGQVPAAQDPFEAVIDFLKASFRVDRLDPRAPGRIPEGTQALLLVKPRGAGPLDALPDRWRFEVERYLAEGGTVLAFMPAIQMGYWQAENQQTWKSGETLSDLLEPLGIGLPPLFLSDNQMHALAVNTEDRVQNIPMPLVLNVSPDQLDSRSALTRSLGGLILPFATPILVDPDNAARKKAGIQVTRLAWSSNQSGTRPFSSNIYAEKNVPLYFTPPKRSEWREGQTVAVLLEGRFPFPFAGKPVPAWPRPAAPPPAAPGAAPGKAPEPLPDPEAGRVARADSRPGRLLLVSFADMLSTDFIQRFQQDYEMTNLEFLENALLAFTLGDDLLQVRRKAARNRPLAEIEPPPFRDFVVAKPGSPVTTTAEIRRNENPDKKADAPPFRDFVALFTSEPVPEEIAAAARSTGGIVLALLPEGLPVEGIERIRDAADPDIKEESKKGAAPKGAAAPEPGGVAEAAKTAGWFAMAPEPRGVRSAFGLPAGKAAVYVDRLGAVVFSGALRDAPALAETIRTHVPGREPPRGTRTNWLKALLVGGSPVLLALLGLLRSSIRRARRLRYERGFGL